MGKYFFQLGTKCVIAAVIMACGLLTAEGQSPDPSAAPAKPSTTKTSTHHKSTNSTAAQKKSGTIHSTSGKRSSKKKKSSRARGQQKIDSDRARSIQEALIKQHYLEGEPTGTWNQSSEDAMRRYQADHGWQSKTVPDSRALISLGLGPSKDHLLNPESAMTTGPESPKAESLPATSQSPAPVSSATPSKSDPPNHQ